MAQSASSPTPEDRERIAATSLVQNTGTEELLPDAGVQTDVTGASGSATAVTPLPGIGLSSSNAIGGRLSDIWRLLIMNPKVAFGLSIVIFFVLVAIFGPLFVTRDPNALSVDVLVAPSAHHLFGTTQTGQDVFAQVVVGTRTSVLWGLATGLVVTIISVAIGLVAGYFGGVIDEILSLLINVFLVLPAFPLAILLASFVAYKGPFTVAVVITLTSWAWGARVLRAQTLSMRRRDFVEAAQASGEMTARIIFFEILPNEIAIVAANFVGTVIFVILAEAGLEFLGLGDPSVVSWGSMFYWAQNNQALLVGAWWWFLPPGLCIAILGAALSFINFGIDEMANPRLRRERGQKALTPVKKAVAS